MADDKNTNPLSMEGHNFPKPTPDGRTSSRQPEPKDECLRLTVLIDGPAGVLKAQIPHDSQEQAHQQLIAALGEYYKGMREAGLPIPRMRPERRIAVPGVGKIRPSRN
jgi:hypothetical protein